MCVEVPSQQFENFFCFVLCTAQVAFGKIGDLLQERRKRDLYEMVQYHTSNYASNDDPAREDESLQSKLEENHKYYSKRMDDMIDKYVFQFLDFVEFLTFPND